MVENPHIEEAAILSTCNRMEVTIVGLSYDRAVAELERMGCSSSGMRRRGRGGDGDGGETCARDQWDRQGGGGGGGGSGGGGNGGGGDGDGGGGLLAEMVRHGGGGGGGGGIAYRIGVAREGCSIRVTR